MARAAGLLGRRWLSYVSTGSGLRTRELKATMQTSWRNKPVEEGQAVRIRYALRPIIGEPDAEEDAGEILEEGTKQFKAGNGRTLKAFDEGVVGMRVGDVRRVRAPHTHAYAEKGHPPLVQPFEEVIFDITLTGAVHHVHIEVLEDPEVYADTELMASIGAAARRWAKQLGITGSDDGSKKAP